MAVVLVTAERKASFEARHDAGENVEEASYDFFFSTDALLSEINALLPLTNACKCSKS